MRREMIPIRNHVFRSFYVFLVLVSFPGHAQQPSALSETYGDWMVRCGQVSLDYEGTTKHACYITQDLLQQGTLRRIFAIEVSPYENNGLRMSLVAPFGLLLSEGVALTVADFTFATVPFTTCQPIGCIGHVNLSADMVELLRDGKTLTLSMKSAADNPLSFEVSLTGFTRAETRMDALLQKNE